MRLFADENSGPRATSSAGSHARPNFDRGNPCLKPPNPRSRRKRKARRWRSSSPFSPCCWRLPKPAPRTPSTGRRKTTSKPRIFSISIRRRRSARPSPRRPQASSKRRRTRSPTPRLKRRSTKESPTSRRRLSDLKKMQNARRQPRENAGAGQRAYRKARNRQSPARTLRTRKRPCADRDRARSAAIITGITALVWLGGALGATGAALVAFGFFAPTILPLVS